MHEEIYSWETIAMVFLPFISMLCYYIVDFIQFVRKERGWMKQSK